MRWNILLITFTFPGYFGIWSLRTWIKQHCHWLKEVSLGLEHSEYFRIWFRIDICRSFPIVSSVFQYSCSKIQPESRHKVCLFLSITPNLAAHYPVLGFKMLVQTNVKEFIVSICSGIESWGFMRMTMTSTIPEGYICLSFQQNAHSFKSTPEQRKMPLF